MLQMLVNVRSPVPSVPSQMLTNARRNVSECFPDVTGVIKVGVHVNLKGILSGLKMV